MGMVTERNLKFTTNVAYEVTESIWAIKKFRLICDLTEDMTKVAMVFNAGNSIGLPSRWKLYLLKTEDEDQLRLHLQLLECPTKNTSVFGQLRYKIGDEQFKFPEIERMFPNDYKKASWGFRLYSMTEFMSPANEKLNKSVLVDGDFILRFQFTLFNNNEFKAKSEEIRSELPDETLLGLHLDFQTLLDSGEFSDVDIKTKDGKMFKAHKNVLSTRSPVFAAMFKHKMAEASSGIVCIDDLTFGAMKTLLKFIYTEKLDVGWKENIVEVVDAAEKYSLPLLKKYCDKALASTCTPENALNLKQLAKLYGLTTAEKNIVEYIRANFDEVMKAI